MENGEREITVGVEAKARRKNKKRKREKASKREACTGSSTASDLSRLPMTPTQKKGKPHVGTGEAATGALGAAGTGRVGEVRGRGEISLPSVSGKKRPRDGKVPVAAAAVQSGSGASKSKHHPFPTEYGDHFETPLQAYRDIEGALTLLSKLLGKKKKHLRIWDPYYCAGRTPRLLAQLGFHKVEHSNQDFYKVAREKRQPKHDVLITNPPYSGDHKKRCLEYCRASGKPWFLLVPNYVATKDYYRLAVLGTAAGPGGEPFYVVPETKYSFDHPEGTGHADSPFSGVWYVHCGGHTEAVFKGAIADKRGGVSVLRSLDELSRTGAVTTERRLNPRQRKALKKKRSAAAAAGLS